MSEAREVAANTAPAEGDAICAGVLELMQRVLRGAPVAPDEGLDPIEVTANSRWLDALDSETRAGWPGYGQP